MIEIKEAKKAYYEGTHRIRRPEDTLRWIEPKLSLAGITRVANITGLDRIGIPIFSAIRPSAAEGAVSVYSGKGITETLAKISAIMEGFERYSAEFRDEKIIKGTYSQLLRNYNVLDPESLILPKDLPYSKNDSVIRWTWGFDLMSKEEILVPVSAVYHPYYPKGDLHLFRTNTNGLAAGNSIEEAIFHGLMEVIERDAWSIAEFCRKGGRIIETDSELVNTLIEKFKAASVDIILRDITSDIPITVIAAVSDDLLLKDPALLTIGFGAHLDPEIAAIRALLEVAQSRVVQIQGAREDTVKAELMRKIGYDRMKRLNKHWFEEGDVAKLEKLPNLSSEYIKSDIEKTLSMLKSRGFEKVIAVNLTRAELEVPTVRVIVPGLEVFGIDPARVGERIIEFRRR
ncbi:MAG: YcaO-related McrA-glycine thioamidation protein [Archaeoglobales archaeon]|nr:YcaO-related McrA-glycine thioamidation protein [Archaeoglobales archaeon]